MIDHLCVRRLACVPFPDEDAVKIARFAAAVRRLAEEHFDYEIVTDYFSEHLMADSNNAKESAWLARPISTG